MRKKIKSILVMLMAMTMLLGCTLTVSATGLGQSANDAYNALRQAVVQGSFTPSNNSPYNTGGEINFTTTSYKLKDGGFLYYTELANDGLADSRSFCVPGQLEKLTGKAKQDFLKDELRIANAMVWETDNGFAQGSGVTTETVDLMLRDLQNNAGMGSQLLATLLAETKPDYASANKIYKPFSGVIGTIIALLAIVVMALLGVTMGMDIAYITIPAFQMACNGGENGGGQGGPGGGGSGGKKGVGAFISKEAIKAVEASDKGEGGQAGSGEYKAAVGIYLKYRWKGLTLLGLCLLYLVQGQIYNFVAWFIDLFSGFLGF